MKQIKYCKECGNEITGNKKDFCSNMCRNLNNGSRIKFNCDYCGEECSVKKSSYENKTNHFCSRNCLAKWQSENLSGENSHNYAKVEVKCSYCKKNIKIKPYKLEHQKNHFCSIECNNKWQSENWKGENNHNYKKINVRCSYCGKAILVAPCKLELQENHFCNKECLNNWNHERNIKFDCDYCGKKHSVKKSLYEKSKNHFCSIECNNKWQSENWKGENSPNWKGGDICFYCDWCGNEHRQCRAVYKNNKNHFCSQSCKSLWQSENLSGESNPSYNPNLTDEERIIRRSYSEYYQWRKDVYIRDEFICQCCGDDKGGNLNAHHINGYNWYLEGRTDVNNGITLCDACHKEYHSIYGYGDNTMLQYFQFMANKKIFNHYQDSVTINEKWIKELEL